MPEYPWMERMARDIFLELPCAVCGLFFPPEELTDGLCAECLENEEAAYEDLLEEEPF